ncbi:MAG: hypothetical protein HYU29_03510 [Chloroflexi bacterium]|nr:hypothetical protein [Chloroflexota bacterium]
MDDLPRAMSLHVITERVALPSYRKSVLSLLRQLRTEKMSWPGCLPGVIWQDASNENRIFTLDTWQTIGHYRDFHQTTATRMLVEELEVLLEKPSSIQLAKDVPIEDFPPRIPIHPTGSIPKLGSSPT